MQVNFYYASGVASKIVTKYLFLSAAPEDNVILDRYVPDGSVAIVINSEPRVCCYWLKKKHHPTARFLVIPMRESLIIQTEAPLESMIIMCKASVFSRLFSVNLDLMGVGPFQELPRQLFFRLLEMMPQNVDYEQKILFFERLLLNHTPLSIYKPDAIDHIFDAIRNNIFLSSVSDLVVQHGFDERTFRRHFLHRVGINAKCLARITRVHQIWDMTLRPDAHKPDVFDMVISGGYCDQSHFINDFKKIVGETPKSFFGRNLEKAMFLSGKKMIEPKDIACELERIELTNIPVL